MFDSPQDFEDAEDRHKQEVTDLETEIGRLRAIITRAHSVLINADYTTSSRIYDAVAMLSQDAVARETSQG